MYGYDKYSLHTVLEQPSPIPSATNPQPSYTPFLTSPASEIEANAMMNAKISYEVHRNIKLFLNGRNVLNNKKRQFYAGEQIGAMYLAGFTIDY